MRRWWVALLAVLALAVLGFEIGFAFHWQAQNQHEWETAVLKARYDDCVAGNKTRLVLQQNIAQQKASLPLTRKLFPNIPDRLFQQAARRYEHQIAAFAPRDCGQFARLAKP